MWYQLIISPLFYNDKLVAYIKSFVFIGIEIVKSSGYFVTLVSSDGETSWFVEIASGIWLDSFEYNLELLELLLPVFYLC